VDCWELAEPFMWLPYTPGLTLSSRMTEKRDDSFSLTETDRRLGLRPLTARSLLVSMLLGTHPPRLPVGVLVAAAGLFEISEGAARTALSRMVAAGETTVDDGWYELGPSLVERQRRQDTSRQIGRDEWDGSWRTMIVTGGPRSAAERTSARAQLFEARFAELREGVWSRPTNLDTAAVETELMASDWLSARVQFDTVPAIDDLWPIAELQEQASGLRGAIARLTPALEAGDHSVLARGFVVAAAGLRFFRADPLLPTELLSHEPLSAGWEGDDLRSDYDHFDAAYRRVLREFFESSRD
jgi:phenylacetic acid degradation operon negative regulatory protein